MAKHNALTFSGHHIGAHQYILKMLRHNPYDLKQWFVFDWRTKTIRTSSDRNKVVANRLGYKFRINNYAVARPYRNSWYDRLHWNHGPNRNIRNNGNYCLGVQGANNAVNHYTTFQNCHEGDHQAWVLDKRGAKKVTYPLGNQIKF
jgi:hypothetical protein